MPEDTGKDVDRLLERASRMSGQLGNWTMAANAGGIAFVLTAVRDQNLGIGQSLGGAYITFVVGIVCGFLGHLFLLMTAGGVARSAMEYQSASDLIEFRKTLTDELKGRGITPSPEWAERDAADEKRMEEAGRPVIAIVFAVIGILLYTVSAGAAVSGLLVPVFHGFI